MALLGKTNVTPSRNKRYPATKMLPCKPEPCSPVPAPRGRTHPCTGIAAGCARLSVAAPKSNQRLPRRERSNKACGMLSPWGKRGEDASWKNCCLWDSGRSAQQSRCRASTGDARGKVWCGNEPPMHVVTCCPTSTRSPNGRDRSCPREPKDKPLHTSWRCARRQERPIPGACFGPLAPAIQ